MLMIPYLYVHNTFVSPFEKVDLLSPKIIRKLDQVNYAKLKYIQNISRHFENWFGWKMFDRTNFGGKFLWIFLVEMHYLISLNPLLFKKYSINWVLEALCSCLCRCLGVLVFVFVSLVEILQIKDL